MCMYNFLDDDRLNSQSPFPLLFWGRACSSLSSSFLHAVLPKSCVDRYILVILYESLNFVSFFFSLNLQVFLSVDAPSVTMKLEFPTLLWLLLNATAASSFGTFSPTSVRPSFTGARSKPSSHQLTFLDPRGGSSSTSSSSLSASVDSSTSTSVSAANLALLSERGKKAVLNLIEHDTDGAQTHVYGNWPEAGIQDEGKKKLAEQVCRKKRRQTVSLESVFLLRFFHADFLFGFVFFSFLIL